MMTEGEVSQAIREGNYETEELGTFFSVLIFDDFVVKIPKLPKVEPLEKLDLIAKIQTYLSQHFDEIQPCYRVGKRLITPRAKGVRADLLPKEQGVELMKRGLEIAKQVEDLGYILKDIAPKNIFYDEETDSITLIDFHGVKSI